MKTKYKWILAGILILLILLFFPFSSIFNKKPTPLSYEERVKEVKIDKSNFAYIGNDNINSYLANKFCSEYKARNCQAIAEAFNIPYNEINPECWKHFWNFEYKLINMPEEVLPLYSNVKCKAYQDGELLKTKVTYSDGSVHYEEFEDFGSPEGSETQGITFWVDVTKDSNIMLCCRINNTRVIEGDQSWGEEDSNGRIRWVSVKAGDIEGILSNEVCLDPIQIKSCKELPF